MAGTGKALLHGRQSFFRHGVLACGCGNWKERRSAGCHCQEKQHGATVSRTRARISGIHALTPINLVIQDSSPALGGLRRGAADPLLRCSMHENTTWMEEKIFFGGQLTPVAPAETHHTGECPLSLTLASRKTTVGRVPVMPWRHLLRLTSLEPWFRHTRSQVLGTQTLKGGRTQM